MVSSKFIDDLADIAEPFKDLGQSPPANSRKKSIDIDCVCLAVFLRGILRRVQGGDAYLGWQKKCLYWLISDGNTQFHPFRLDQG